MTTNKFFHKTLFILIALAVMVSGFGFAPRAEAASAAPAEEAKATCSLWHTVKSGDTIYTIARLYNIKWAYIYYWNALSRPAAIQVGQVLCVKAEGTKPVVNPPTQSNEAYFEIRGVTKDKNVTVRTYKFPVRTTFDVFMDVNGTTAARGFLVDTFNSGKGGTFSLTFTIPSQLRGDKRIVIRIENRSSGAFQYITFANLTTGSQGGGGGGNVPPSGVGSRVDSADKRLYAGEETDLRFGAGGIFTESASQNGTVEITRLDLRDTDRLNFVELGMEVRAFQNNGVEITSVKGLVYVYFLLNADTRASWRAGDLDIYYYNPSSRAWQRCGSTFVNDRNRPNGRLLCEIGAYGIYGLAERK